MFSGTKLFMPVNCIKGETLQCQVDLLFYYFMPRNVKLHDFFICFI